MVRVLDYAYEVFDKSDIFTVPSFLSGDDFKGYRNCDLDAGWPGKSTGELMSFFGFANIFLIYIFYSILIL